MRILTKSQRDKLNAFIEAEGLVLDDPIMCPSWAVTGALDLMNSLEAQIDAIEAIARAHHDTTTIGGAHAALREILAVIEGVDDADNSPQTCPKCTGTGFIQAPCTDPAHRHGHVECKSCPGGGGLTAQKCDECCADVEGDQ